VYKLRRVDIERVPEILRRLEEYVGALVEELNPHLVILFGSFARGEDINEGSDIDLLVVAGLPGGLPREDRKDDEDE
jgi:predicted nucleotidyltransferase